MYNKNLTEDFRLRLSTTDMDFLRTLSAERSISVSECLRGIIGEYRRSLDTLKVFSQALDLAQQGKLERGQLSNGDTKTNIDH